MRPPVHVMIGDVWVDVTIREGHGISAEVTEHPVELGSDVTDHIRPTPRSVQIEGVVSNTPIELPGSHTDGARIDPLPLQIEGEPSVGAIGIVPGVDQATAILGALRIQATTPRVFAATPLRWTQEFDRITAVHSALVQTVQESRLVTLVTGLEVYANMAIEDLHAERTGQGGGRYLQFSASLRQVRIVRSQTAALPDPVVPRGLPSQSRGKQATSEVDPSTLNEGASKSFAANLAGL